MIRKNRPSYPWMLGALLIFTLISYRTLEATKQMAMHHALNPSAQNGVFEFLEYFFGINTINPSLLSNSEQGPNTGNSSSGKDSNQRNLNSTASQTLESAGENNNSRASMEDTANGNQGASAEGHSSENNAGTKTNLETENSSSSSNTENLADNSTTNSADNTNASINADNNAESNASNNSSSNADNNTNTDSNNNLGNNPGDNSGSSADTTQGATSGNNGNNTAGWNGSGSNLPTINPIPSNDEVSQKIAKQNQQSDALANLIASRQALVVPAQQEAQASKYQTVTAQNLPSPSTTAPPLDVEEKIKAKQITLH